MAIHVFPDAWFDEEEILNPPSLTGSPPTMRFSQMEGVSIASTGRAPSVGHARGGIGSISADSGRKDQGRRVVWLGFRPLISPGL